MTAALLTLGLAAPARAAPTVPPPTDSLKLELVHQNPRLKISYRQLSIANLDGTQVPLRGGQLDVYPLSRRWARFGLELEAGAGSASLEKQGVDLWYALTGLSLGLQLPARVTPFVDGRFAFGVLGGHLTAAASPGSGLSLTQASAVTYLLVGGLEVGVELYVVNRVYLTLALGWAHSIYRGVDYAAIKAVPSTLAQKDIESDAFTFKLGFGI